MILGVQIGEAAKRSGVKVPTIRYYEQIGLLAAPARSDGNRRHYDASDLHRLTFIRGIFISNALFGFSRQKARFGPRP